MYLNAKSELYRTRHLELRACKYAFDSIVTFTLQHTNTLFCFCDLDLDIRPWPRYYGLLPACRKWTF